MARPKHPKFRLNGALNFTSIKCAMLKAYADATRAGRWPGRPPLEDQMSDCEWLQLKRRSRLPEVIDGIEVRALFEHTVANARRDIEAERMRAPERLKREQLDAIVSADVGAVLAVALHADVVGLLTGMAWRDRRFGKGDWSALEHCRNYVRAQTVVTHELKEWASWCLMLGVGVRSHRGGRGGGHTFAEAMLVSELLNFWADILRRPIKPWVDPANEDQSAAAVNHFVLACLQLAGVRARTALPTRKIRMGDSIGRRLPHHRNLTLGDAHQRILRVHKEMKAAAAAGLQPNVLSRKLNP